MNKQKQQPKFGGKGILILFTFEKKYMKKYFHFVFLLSLNCLAQVNSNTVVSKDAADAIPINLVDQIPLFENCKSVPKEKQKDCLLATINLHLKYELQYPTEARRVKVTSTVFTKFIVDKEGNITNIEVQGKPTSFKKAFENEAKRVIQSLPKLIPGKHKNKLVKVQIMLPVEFVLDEEVEVVKSESTIIDINNHVAVAESDEYLDEAVPFAVVEQIPLFENCKNVERKEQMNCFHEEIKKHIDKQLKYPKAAKKDKIEDRVITVFEIDKQGKVNNIQVRGRKSEYQLLFEAEAKRIIEALPQFSPGLQRGKPIVVKYGIPISFTLKK
mgnify:FL=1